MATEPLKPVLERSPVRTGGPTPRPARRRPGPGPVGATNAAQRSAQALIRQSLDQWGLGALAGWVWNQYLRSGTDDPSQALMLIMPDLRNRPEYKARFPAMAELAKRGQAISESDYISYEKSVAQVMRSAGLPPGFYNDPKDYARLLVANVSPAEVQDRVVNGYAKVANAPATVRAAFADFFGANGDNALAAFFIDPTHALPKLEQEVQTATIAGIGRRFGIDTGLSTATQLAEQGISADQAETGYANLNESKGLFQENVGETTDLTVEQQGVGAVFGLNATDRLAVEKRSKERQAAFAGSGEAAQTQAGAAGLGVAGRGS